MRTGFSDMFASSVLGCLVGICGEHVQSEEGEVTEDVTGVKEFLVSCVHLLSQCACLLPLQAAWLYGTSYSREAD